MRTFDKIRERYLVLNEKGINEDANSNIRLITRKSDFKITRALNPTSNKVILVVHTEKVNHKQEKG